MCQFLRYYLPFNRRTSVRKNCKLLWTLFCWIVAYFRTLKLRSIQMYISTMHKQKKIVLMCKTLSIVHDDMAPITEHRYYFSTFKFIANSLLWELTLFMWICCWYCFCFSKNCWCCCWMTSWAKVLWGRGADWVLFSGLWRGSLWAALMPGETLSFAAKGDCGWRGTAPAKHGHFTPPWKTTD